MTRASALKPAAKRKLQSLQKRVIEGERSRIDRDLMIFDLFNSGVTQIDMAAALDEVAAKEEWEFVTRNSVQKIVQRQRSFQDGS